MAIAVYQFFLKPNCTKTSLETHYNCNVFRVYIMQDTDVAIVIKGIDVYESKSTTTSHLNSRTFSQ